MFLSISGFFCMKRWALIETWVPMRILTFSCATAAPLARTAAQTLTIAKRRCGFIGSSLALMHPRLRLPQFRVL